MIFIIDYKMMNTEHSNYIGDQVTQYQTFDDMPMFDCDEPNIDLLQGINSYGFSNPSAIQEIATAPIFEGKNLIAQSQSGTGKTGAFVIGSLSKIDPKLESVQIVAVAPTHELAVQIHHVYQSIGQYLINPKKVELCVGKQVSVEENISHIKNGAQILVGTPGRIAHLCKQQIKQKQLVNPEHVKILVLDEADKLIASDSRMTINDIAEALDNREIRGADNFLQFAIFSATYNKAETIEDAMRLSFPGYDPVANPDYREHPQAPLKILLKPDELTLKGIEQYFYDLECDGGRDVFQNKVNFIEALNQEHMIPVCIIYVNNRNAAEKLKSALNSLNMVCECIYGSLPSKQRMEITDAFRQGEVRILITTDLLARGFDVHQVSLVINFDLPYVYDRHRAENDEQRLADYLHRIGRSGRYGRKGVAINILGTSGDRHRREIIEEFYNTKMAELPEDVSSIY